MENFVDHTDQSESSDDLQDVFCEKVNNSEFLLNKVFTEFVEKDELSKLDTQLLQGVYTNDREKLKVPSIFKKYAKDKPGFESIFRKKRNRQP